MEYGIYRRLVPYGVAVGATTIALLLTLWFEPFLTSTVVALFYLAIIITTWYGGIRPGIFAIVLSTLAINYFFTPPLYKFTIADPSSAIRLIVFGIIAFIINLLSNNLRESKQTVEQLSQRLQEESAEQLRMALTTAQMGLWDWDLVSEKITWSPEHEYLFGLAPGTFDGRYETFDARLHPDDRPGLRDAIQQAIQNHTIYQHEYRVVWADGSIHWLEGRGQAVYDAVGRPVRMAGTIMNIDSRKRAESALARSEQQLRAIFEVEPECVKVITIDGILQTINPKGLAILEADSVEQATGQCIFPLIDPAHRQQFQEFIQEVARGTAGMLEFEGVGLKGTRRWLESYAVPLNIPGEAMTQVLAVTRDITDRKRTDAALRQSEERLLAILQNMPVMLDAFDENWNIVAWNQECERVTGFSAAEVIDNPTIMEQFYPDAAYRGQMMVAWAERGNNYRNWEWDITCKDGSTRTVSWSNISDQFPVAGWASWGVGVDVTDRKYAEAQLRQLNLELEQRVAERTAELSEANDRLQKELFQRERTERALQQSELKFHAIFDQSRLFIGLLRPDGTVFEVNQRPHELTERMGEVFVGRLFWELAIWGPQNQPQMRAVIERALAGEVVRLEMNIHTQDGSLMQMPDGGFVTHDIRVKAVRNAAGQVMFLTVEGWDISDLKRAESALRASEVKFRSLSESSPVGVFMADAEGQNVYTNPRAQEICGYSFEEALGNGWVRFIHPDDLQTLLGKWTAQAVEQTRSVYEEIRYVRGDGTVRRYGRVQIVPLLKEDGTPSAFIGTIEDITERRTIDRMKNEFISIVSHELRTPLTAIRGSLGLILRGVYDQRPDKKQRMIEIASEQSDRLVRLVNDILDLQRLESGSLKLTLQACDAAALMQQSADTMQAYAEEHQIQLIVTPLPLSVWASPDAVIQTLTNLLSNAIKFSQPGGEIWLTVQQQVDTVLFTVRDQGRGIPADKLETIFERFQQVDASDSREKGGTGLGLAICRRIIEQHNGRIWAESVLSQGSTFYFTLPVAE